MKHRFLGLKEWDAHPHYFENMIKDKIYDLDFNDYGDKSVEDEAGKLLILSNSKIKGYFKKV